MAISFNAIGEQYVTFLAAETAQEGAVCKMSGNDTVDVCGAGDDFCGVIAQCKGGSAAVILGGYVELPYSGGELSTGYAVLAADGNGGVKEAQTGRKCLVVRVDTAAQTVGLFL